MSAGDEFEQFIRSHSRSLFHTAFLLCGRHAAAEDLVQDCLIRLYPRWDRVMAADSPLAYVRRSLVNSYISSRRSSASRDLLVWDLPDGSDGTDLADREVDRQLTWHLVAELTERQRAAIVLRYFHDLPDADIASALNCRTGTVRSLLSRALDRMQSSARASMNDSATEAVQ